MTSVESDVREVKQFIGGRVDRRLRDGGTFEDRDPFTGERRRARCRPARGRMRRRAVAAAAAAVPGLVRRALPAAAPGDLPQGRRHPRVPPRRGRRAARARDRRHASASAMFQMGFVPGLLRQAAALAYAPLGADHPLRPPGHVRDGHPQAGRRRRRDRAVERGADPVGALDRRAARAREHRRAEAVRAVADRRRPALGRDLQRGRACRPAS